MSKKKPKDHKHDIGVANATLVAKVPPNELVLHVAKTLLEMVDLFKSAFGENVELVGNAEWLYSQAAEFDMEVDGIPLTIGVQDTRLTVQVQAQEYLKQKHIEKRAMSEMKVIDVISDFLKFCLVADAKEGVTIHSHKVKE